MALSRSNRRPVLAGLAWRDRWPLLAMQLGAVAGAAGMIGGQLAQRATTGQVVFTAVFSVLFAGAIWLLVRGAAHRLSQTGRARVPDQEPQNVVLIGVLITSIVMWLTAAYGVFVAVNTGRPQHDWHALGYLGVAVCATGATAMLRQARVEWAEVHRKAWPTED